MIIRQAAFEGKGKMLKGNLHCHTTRSDALGTPYSVSRQYAASGYDFLALTDHNIYNFDQYSPEDDLLILPGMEVDTGLPGPDCHCVHVVSLGPEKEMGNGFDQDQRFRYPQAENAGQAQIMIDDILKANNLPMYCHPEWSGTPAQEIEELQGFSLMEIWNTGCVLDNGLDKDAAYWDELLMAGRVVYGVATDDGHSAKQNCQGYIMVNAEKNVQSILEALKRGAFYASCGPVIYDFYVEDGVATVLCSPAASIRFRHLRNPYQDQKGIALTGAQAPIPKGQHYVRAEVTDHLGRKAWTNPIFVDWEDEENA